MLCVVPGSLGTDVTRLATVSTMQCGHKIILMQIGLRPNLARASLEICLVAHGNVYVQDGDILGRVVARAILERRIELALLPSCVNRRGTRIRLVPEVT